MFVAKVTGSVVATQKVDTMRGHKLLIVEPYRIEANERNRLVTTGRTFVAVDTSSRTMPVLNTCRMPKTPVVMLLFVRLLMAGISLTQ